MLYSETEKNDNLEKIPPKKKWKSVLGFFLLLLILAAVAMWFWLQKPAVSRNIKVLDSVTEDEKTSRAKERFEGKYLSFSHSADYAVKYHTDETPENGVIWETAFFSTSEINSTKVALTVENMQNRVLADATAYNLRKMRPEDYREEKFSAGEISGVAFTASNPDSYEKVVFIPHENFLVSMALTGPFGSNEEKDQELEDIVRSIQWKK